MYFFFLNNSRTLNRQPPTLLERSEPEISDIRAYEAKVQSYEDVAKIILMMFVLGCKYIVLVVWLRRRRRRGGEVEEDEGEREEHEGLPDVTLANV